VTFSEVLPDIFGWQSILWFMDVVVDGILLGWGFGVKGNQSFQDIQGK